MSSVQLRVQLPCKRRVGSVSAGPCLPIGELHACTRVARSPSGIGSKQVGKNKVGIDLIVGNTPITPKIVVDGSAYIQAPHRRDNRLSLGQWLGHDELGNDCEALILLDNLRRGHRFEQPVRHRYAGFEAKDRGGAGVGGKHRPVRFIDLLSLFRGSSEKTCCRRATPNFGGGF
jgi:hypothetical protein